MTPIRILIADDHALMRIGLKSILDLQPDMTVVCEASNGQEAVKLADQHKPDVIIMDLLMPQLNGAEATRLILERDPDAKVMILTSYGMSTDLGKAIQFGAIGAQPKEVPTEAFLAAVRTVAAGKQAIAPEFAAQIAESNQLLDLTQRQQEILTSLVRGLTNAEIGRQFGISPITVNKHIAVICTKLNAANRTEAVSIALRKQLLKI